GARERSAAQGRAPARGRAGDGMKKVGLVAAHEFLATISTRAFILGLLATPAIIALAAIVYPRTMSRSVQVHGEIAVIDPTAAVFPELRTALGRERILA